jgi:hypothetical protein
MIVEEIKVKPFWKRWLCNHDFTGGIRVVSFNRSRRKHARICKKCGKRVYVD